MNTPKQQPLTTLQQENLEAAQLEADAIKREMKQRLARIIARAQTSGEMKPGVTVDDILRDAEEPEL